MLTKDLLEVTKRKPNISPRYREIEEYRSVAEQVIAAYEPGTTRGDIAEAVAALETHDTFKLVRGLSKLVERHSTFEQQAPAPPADLRAAAFERGFVTEPAERADVLSTVAAEYELTPAEVENGLWADLEKQAVLVSPAQLEPEELLRQYNLSLTQTLLFDAVELEFTVSENYQEIFGLTKYLGLMYRVDEDLAVTVTGPAALFKQTRKYGTTLAKLLPAILKAEEWALTAQVETEVSNETRLYEFSLDESQAGLFPDKTTTNSFDSEVERDFATRIGSLADGWTVSREPTILRAENRVMIPDFGFERTRGNREAEFYLEVIGFWTPSYLEEKLAKVRVVESTVPLMLAVNEALNCTEEEFENPNVDQVFFYTDSIPVKPVLSRLNAIDQRYVEADLQMLAGKDIEIPSGNVTAITDLARRQEVEPDAMRQYLASNCPGSISNGQYVPEDVLETIREEFDSLNAPTVADIAPILEEYDLAQTIVDEIGYTIEYQSLNENEARVRKAQE